MLHLFMDGNFEEWMTKGEIDFFQKFIPKLEEDSKLKTPKCYFVGENTEIVLLEINHSKLHHIL